MIAALYVAPGGCYDPAKHPELAGEIDFWPEARDARLYAGPWPVVAHPPCARWCRLAALVQSQGGKAVGDDGGTFAAALASVRAFGGVLEHPAWSLAWGAHGLLAPPAFGWVRDMFGEGWVCEVSQAAYGHRAPKATWLYYVGETVPPPLNWSKPATGVTCTTTRGKRRGVQEMSGKSAERSATPPAFRDALLSLARLTRPAVEAPPTGRPR